MSIAGGIKPLVVTALKDLYGQDIPASAITINSTKPEFEGDYTIVLFSFVKQLKKAPEVLGREIGEYLVTKNAELFSSYNVIKGFLNLTIADAFWMHSSNPVTLITNLGHLSNNGQRVIVEYSSPNTNKPLHLGHLRNNFLGWSVAQLLKVSGYEVVKTAINNDRGIHICKSMVSWLWYGNGETPGSTGIKGDHFVGDYYVRFGEELKKEIEKGYSGRPYQRRSGKESTYYAGNPENVAGLGKWGCRSAGTLAKDEQLGIRRVQ